jgi:hypothetical protein
LSRTITRRALGPALAAAAALAGAQPAQAGIWTPVPSGTTAEISAIEYQAADRLWFTTRTGEIYKRQPDGTFARKHGPTAIPLNDIEFAPTGRLGFAVGNNGQVLRSVDGGEAWFSVAGGIPVSKESTPTPDCTGSEPLGNVNAVRFAGGRVFLFARGAQIARSTSAGDLGGTGTWRDANRGPGGACRVRPAGNAGIADAFFATQDVGYIATAHFGETFFTNNGLDGVAPRQPASAGNGIVPNRRMAGDTAQPNRMWAVGPGGPDVSFTAMTADGWNTSAPFAIGNPGARGFNAPHDVDFAGGTVLVAGDQGMVLNSTDGRAFFHNGADGALAATDWRAASLASATLGAIGGAGGALALTSTASTPPPPPPAVLKTPSVQVRARYFQPRRTTTFTQISITGVPAGSKVVARCLTPKGRRCAGRRLKKAFVKARARGALRIRRFERRRLRPGMRIDIAISNPAYVTQIKIITVRKNRLPRIGTRCRRPGEPARTRC